MIGAWMLLAAAITAEVSASALLPRTQGFTNPGWSALVLMGYGIGIWLLTLIVKHMPVSVAYAIWAGLGTAAVAVIGYLFLGESMSPAKAASLAMIVAGVIGLNLVGAH